MKSTGVYSNIYFCPKHLLILRMTAILVLLIVIKVMGESSSAKNGLLQEIDSKGTVADASGNLPAGINISIKGAIKGKGAIAATDEEVGMELPKAEVKEI